MIEGMKYLLEKQLGKSTPSIANQTTIPKCRRRIKNRNTNDLIETQVLNNDALVAELNWSDIVIPNSIPNKTTKYSANDLWAKVKEANEMRKEKGKAPLDEIDLE